MLNTLLDINQIETGTVHPQIVDFPVNDLLRRLNDEFIYHAQAQKLDLRVVPSRLLVRSDQRLLEQMIRNLISNALKYTERGKVLVGCRRRSGTVSIEIWDTGVGIKTEEFKAIFEEYHQLDNAARERNRGLGLGLSIVQRIGNLLGHRVRLRSQPGKGSVFAIEVPAHSSEAGARQARHPPGPDEAAGGNAHAGGSILIVEDDPEVRELLKLLLEDEGYRTADAVDGIAALELVARGAIRPDLVLADYNLPNGMNGLQTAAKLREKLHRQVPVIILTGDISTETLHNTVLQNCVQLNKPVKLSELTQTLRRLLPAALPTLPAGARAAGRLPVQAPAAVAVAPGSALVYLVDDDRHVREAIRSVLEDDGRAVEDYESCEAFLAAYRPGREACLLIDAYLPGMQGLDLLQRLHAEGHRLPAIMITGNSDVQMAVQAMKAGAADFIEKPIGSSELLVSIGRALEQARDTTKRSDWRQSAANSLAGLTPRQREIMERVLAGDPSKNIAADLGISQRTVENHRAAIMKRTGSRSLPALARLALAAASDEAWESPARSKAPAPALRTATKA